MLEEGTFSYLNKKLKRPFTSKKDPESEDIFSEYNIPSPNLFRVKNEYLDSGCNDFNTEKNSDTESTDSCDIDKACPICFETIKKPGETKCGHKFCFFCIYDWARTKHQCPICRDSINELYYSRNKKKCAVKVPSKTYEFVCYICTKIHNKTSYQGKKLVRCDCKMFFHLDCDRNAAKRPGKYKGNLKCFECSIFESAMKNIDDFNSYTEQGKPKEDLFITDAFCYL